MIRGNGCMVPCAEKDDTQTIIRLQEKLMTDSIRCTESRAEYNLCPTEGHMYIDQIEKVDGFKQENVFTRKSFHV